MPNTTEPDFEVRNLSEYSVNDLEYLLIACQNTFKMLQGDQTNAIQSLDIWQYRIKDALKEAKKRENS